MVVAAPIPSTTFRIGGATCRAPAYGYGVSQTAVRPSKAFLRARLSSKVPMSGNRLWNVIDAGVGCRASLSIRYWAYDTGLDTRLP